MNIQFLDAATASSARLVVRFVDQDALPGTLETVLGEGAAMARFTGKTGQLFEGFVERGGRVVRAVLAGIGKADAEDRAASIERAAAAVVGKYLTSGETAAAFDLCEAGFSAEETVRALIGGWLRSWRWDAYRTTLKDEQKPSLATVEVIGAPAGAQALWEIEVGVAEGVALTRELVTEPANTIYPESFVERCKARMEGTGLTLRVLDDKEMAELGMGALLGVAQGSVRPARLFVMEWMGGEPGARPIAFVGKGVTFDTGGISLKQPGGMEDMKWDMGGAGAVAGTMFALAKRKAKANVVGLCGLVENMPDGNAQRPGDVVTTMSGQTVEVINTDAEGRLVMCDVLTYAQKTYAPVRIMDLATLTGAIMISLGQEHAGLFSNDDALAADLAAAGLATGEKLWRMPMGPAYDKLIDSAIADMKNVGPRFGGSITAAQFLERFIEDGLPWAHLDIAGMVWADKPGATWDKGATGFGVRLLDRFIRDTAEG
ncbi:leucyl aminopeptidase [Novosphingobium sp. 1949]|uniref:Probable cytosol aminopeptidase n=1 Tax=Novosphingobium organovorum TaxID=2930092 RepID=A0ABT0B933_9SPHN|nr:leucyl aminopeptidase [Novosphingobium organovorum]MCJ2181580.1 leucyl aminopeptidase [Novosphingobium organovorum]